VKKPLQPTKPIVDQDRGPYLIGYARVSMADQSPQLQDALKAHGVPEDRIYFDRKSGSGVEREQFELMLRMHARVTSSSCGSWTASAATCAKSTGFLP
jgi:hypothetical protein